MFNLGNDLIPNAAAAAAAAAVTTSAAHNQLSHQKWHMKILLTVYQKNVTQ